MERSTRRTLAASTVAAGLIIATPLVMSLEGKRNVDYLDIVGVPTACYGQTGTGVRVGTRRTDPECRTMLARSLREHAENVRSCVTVDPPATRFAALLSLEYNIGRRAFCGSTVVRRLNAGDDAGSCAHFSDWVVAGGRRQPGLVNRRARERALCEQ